MQPTLFLLLLTCFVIFPSLACRAMRREILRIAGMFGIFALVGLPVRADRGENTRAPYGEMSIRLLHCFPQGKNTDRNELTDA